MSEFIASDNADPHVEQSPLPEIPNRYETGPAEDSACDDELGRARKENAGLKEALRSRTVIGQATGLLMAVLHRTPDDAFAELVKMSSHGNRKLRDIAADVVAVASASAVHESVRSNNQLESLLQSSSLPRKEARPDVRDRASLRSCEDPVQWGP